MPRTRPIAGNTPRRRGRRRVDDYHGTKVADPFRPLEDPDAPGTRAWVEAENKITFGFLESIPERAAIQAPADRALGLREIRPAVAAKAAATSTPTTRGLQNQSVLYTADSLDGEAQVLARPQHASRPTAPWRCPGPSVSDDGKLLAYGIAAAGSDWNDVEGPRRRDRPGPARPISSGSSSPAPSGPRTARASSTAAFPSPSRARTSRGPTTTRRSTTTGWAPQQADDRLVWEDPEHKDWRADPDRHRRRPVPDPDDREGDRRQVPGPLSAARPARSQAGRTWSATSTPTTRSSTTTARSSGSRPTRTRRAARSSPSTPASPSPRTGSS